MPTIKRGDEERYYRPVQGGRLRRPPITNEVVVPLPTWKCIGCNDEHTSLVGSIRGRILRGYMVMRMGKVTLLDTPPVDTIPRPSYANGRMCLVCSPKYRLSDVKPTQRGYIQFIKDATPVEHKHASVTRGDVEREDIIEEVHKAEQVKKVSRIGKLVMVEDDTTLVKSNQVEELDMNAFRKFMRSRGGGKKDYEKNLINRVDNDANHYDDEVNYSNIKSDKRWFNRG